MSNLYAALEIGTTRTVLAIGEARAGERLKVTCHAEIPSSGVRKSQILNIADATRSIHSVLHSIEKKQDALGSKVTIGNALLVVSGQTIKADPFSGTAQVSGSRVGADEIAEVRSLAHQMPLAKDRELLDIAEQDYVLDNLGGISEPRGMAGRVLKLNALHVNADRNRIQDARTAAAGVHLELPEAVFAATCAAEAVLEDHERKNGVLVLDLGGGSTGYAAYIDGYLAAAEVLGVGGDHITNDIAHAFQTTNNQAEEMKVKSASAVISRGDGDSRRVPVPGSNPLMESRTVSRHALDTVVNARLKELFSVIKESLARHDLANRLHAGVVVTGGGAAMDGLAALLEQTLGMNVRTGRPIHVDGLEDEPHPEAFAAIAGALLYAHRNDDHESMLDGILRRFFRK